LRGQASELQAGGCVPVAGDHVAIIGANRKLLVFPLAEIPEMTRGKGVRLQRYKDGGIADIKTFAMADGLTWTDSSGRTFTRSREELAEWLGARAGAGRLEDAGEAVQDRGHAALRQAARLDLA
jgi:topoisomerase IV subunit A